MIAQKDLHLSVVYQDEPVGCEQECFGGEIVDGSTHDALTRFMEAKNAAMMPLLDAAGLAGLYSEDAVLITPLHGLPEQRIAGRAAIEAHFAQLGDIMLSLTHIEERRTVEGRRAVWEGKVEGVQAGTKLKISIPAVFSITFDDADLVCHQHSFYSVQEAKRQLGIEDAAVQRVDVARHREDEIA